MTKLPRDTTKHKTPFGYDKKRNTRGIRQKTQNSLGIGQNTTGIQQNTKHRRDTTKPPRDKTKLKTP